MLKNETAHSHTKHTVIAAGLSRPRPVLARARLAFTQPVVSATNFAQAGASAAANAPGAQSLVTDPGWLFSVRSFTAA